MIGGARARSLALLATPLALIALGSPAHAEIRQKTSDGEILITNMPGVREKIASARIAPVLKSGGVPSLSPQEAVAPGGPAQIVEMVSGSAARYGFDPMFIQAIVAAESAFDQRAVSRTGARGLMQLMPATARRFGLKDVHDPGGNLEAGVAFLRELVQRFDGDVELAVAAYNAGPEAVDRYGGIPPYEETRQYLARIKSFYGRDLRQADCLAPGSGSIRLSKVDESGVPVFTNVTTRRIVRAPKK